MRERGRGRERESGRDTQRERSPQSKRPERERDPQSEGYRLTGTVGGWWVQADPDVQMAKAQSEATWSGTEVVCAAVQQGKTLN